MIEFRSLDLGGVLEIRPVRHSDERGFFSETWNEETYAKAGIPFRFVQDNHSLSRDVGVLRGLHFQSPPFAQDKLIRVTRGSVFDVAVDLGTRARKALTSAVLCSNATSPMLPPMKADTA